MEVRKHEKIREQKNNLGGVDKQPVFREKEWYREKIAEMVAEIKDVWILKAIHNFIVGMTKEGD